MSESGLVEHFFRREYGRLVSTLARRIGTQHLGAIEDAVQYALMKALEVWKVDGVPGNPPAWLYAVARNGLIGELRQRVSRGQLLERYAAGETSSSDAEETFLAGELEDDLLRMLFVCCDETVPPESQLVLALKTLCGFSIHEIALRLLISEANAAKRLGRARSKLRQLGQLIDTLSIEQMKTRAPMVARVLYAMFAEGYFSSGPELAIRRDLCEEAIRLATILAEHPAGQTPDIFALLALTHLQTARMPARRDGAGGLLLLEEQDRTLWDQVRIGIGMQWLSRSAEGETLTRYHAEAAIAAEHCLAPTFGRTNWARVAECYALLKTIAPSPLNRLNRAVAVAEWLGPDVALAELDDLEPPQAPGPSFQHAIVLADLHRRCGHHKVAAQLRETALGLAPSPMVRDVLRRRLQTADAT